MRRTEKTQRGVAIYLDKVMFVLLEELQEWRALPELLGESRTGASRSGYSRFILKSSVQVYRVVIVS